MNTTNDKNTSLEMVLHGMNYQHQAKFIKVVTIIREEHQIPDSLVSDSTLLRFYASVQGDIDQTIQLVVKHAEWRRTYPFDKVINLDLKQFDLYYQCVKMGFYGTDVKGRPIRIIYVTSFDPDILLDRYSEEDMINFQVQYIERIINIVFPLCSSRSKHNISNIVSIIDIKDLNVTKIIMNKRLLNLFRNMTKAFQDNYPELTQKAIIVNANVLFQGLWKIISVFIKQRTLDRVSILGDDYMGELSKHTSIENLPASLNGTCPYEIDKYPNFFDQAIEQSIVEKRLK